jgi:hypothetical protein
MISFGGRFLLFTAKDWGGFMKKFNCVCTLLLSLLSVNARAESQVPANDQAKTRKIMAEIFTALTTVLPMSMDTKEFTDPKNRDKILTELQKMRDSTESFVNHTKRFDGSYGFTAKAMAGDIRDIYNWYQKGSTSEARYLLQQVTDNCVSCHMKLPDPGHAPRMDTFFKDVSIAKLSAPEKTRLQVALRQFDDALATWEEMFKTWPNPTELFAMDTLPEYLKVVIRVKGDMKRAKVALDNLALRSDLPKYMTREVNAWKDSLAKLSTEMTQKGDELKRADKIISNARKTMEYPMDRTGFIDFVVASGLLNRQLLNKAITPEQTSTAYYLLGITESMIGRSTWLSQTDFYLEAAVRAAPKSKSAQKAFDAYEQQIIMEYSGSAGTNIPEEAQQNLEELRRLVRR